MSREIDCLIAEHFYNYYNIHKDVDGIMVGDVDGSSVTIRSEIYPYSTRSLLALRLIEDLNYLSFSINRENCSGARWDVVAYNDFAVQRYWKSTCQDSLAMAVCEVALKSIGIEYNNNKGVNNVK